MNIIDPKNATGTFSVKLDTTDFVPDKKFIENIIPHFAIGCGKTENPHHTQLQFVMKTHPQIGQNKYSHNEINSPVFILTDHSTGNQTTYDVTDGTLTFDYTSLSGRDAVKGNFDLIVKKNGAQEPSTSLKGAFDLKR
ncbi:hypothetical protein N8H71_06280 [Pseudomonas koreensis]|uniref:hypothetical protein n=1 Tax=Pseudomonas koreensis TaxID=198620 RepID=UPI0021C6EB30|nr:hypothetical protein [Pseudomonas koreensis]MCU0071186.1 hypothetical protein [Pseudomonas koreensis]